MVVEDEEEEEEEEEAEKESSIPGNSVTVTFARLCLRKSFNSGVVLTWTKSQENAGVVMSKSRDIRANAIRKTAERVQIT